MQMLAASTEGLVIAFTILWIVFGAIFLLKVLQQTGATDAIKQGFQQALAKDAMLDTQLVLALQILGANAGNMIAVVNVVAAASVVGLHDREGEIVRYTLLPMHYYCFAASLFAWLFFT